MNIFILASRDARSHGGMTEHGRHTAQRWTGEREHEAGGALAQEGECLGRRHADQDMNMDGLRNGAADWTSSLELKYTPVWFGGFFLLRPQFWGLYWTPIRACSDSLHSCTCFPDTTERSLLDVSYSQANIFPYMCVFLAIGIYKRMMVNLAGIETWTEHTRLAVNLFVHVVCAEDSCRRQKVMNGSWRMIRLSTIGGDI